MTKPGWAKLVLLSRFEHVRDMYVILALFFHPPSYSAYSSLDWKPDEADPTKAIQTEVFEREFVHIPRARYMHHKQDRFCGEGSCNIGVMLHWESMQ